MYLIHFPYIIVMYMYILYYVMFNKMSNYANFIIGMIIAAEDYLNHVAQFER